jgi:hypothetical protein
MTNNKETQSMILTGTWNLSNLVGADANNRRGRTMRVREYPQARREPGTPPPALIKRRRRRDFTLQVQFYINCRKQLDAKGTPPLRKTYASDEFHNRVQESVYYTPGRRSLAFPCTQDLTEQRR